MFFFGKIDPLLRHAGSIKKFNKNYSLMSSNATILFNYVDVKENPEKAINASIRP
jgi:hypothetical protein